MAKRAIPTIIPSDPMIGHAIYVLTASPFGPRMIHVNRNPMVTEPYPVRSQRGNALALKRRLRRS